MTLSPITFPLSPFPTPDPSGLRLADASGLTPLSLPLPSDDAISRFQSALRDPASSGSAGVSPAPPEPATTGGTRFSASASPEVPSQGEAASSRFSPEGAPRPQTGVEREVRNPRQGAIYLSSREPATEYGAAAFLPPIPPGDKNVAAPNAGEALAQLSAAPSGLDMSGAATGGSASLHPRLYSSSPSGLETASGETPLPPASAIPEPATTGGTRFSASANPEAPSQGEAASSRLSREAAPSILDGGKRSRDAASAAPGRDALVASKPGTGDSIPDTAAPSGLDVDEAAAPGAALAPLELRLPPSKILPAPSGLAPASGETPLPPAMPVSAPEVIANQSAPSIPSNPNTPSNQSNQIPIVESREAATLQGEAASRRLSREAAIEPNKVVVSADGITEEPEATEKRSVDFSRRTGESGAETEAESPRLRELQNLRASAADVSAPQAAPAAGVAEAAPSLAAMPESTQQPQSQQTLQAMPAHTRQQTVAPIPATIYTLPAPDGTTVELPLVSSSGLSPLEIPAAPSASAISRFQAAMGDVSHRVTEKTEPQSFSKEARLQPRTSPEAPSSGSAGVPPASPEGATSIIDGGKRSREAANAAPGRDALVASKPGTGDSIPDTSAPLGLDEEEAAAPGATLAASRLRIPPSRILSAPSGLAATPASEPQSIESPTIPIAAPMAENLITPSIQSNQNTPITPIVDSPEAVPPQGEAASRRLSREAAIEPNNVVASADGNTEELETTETRSATVSRRTEETGEAKEAEDTAESPHLRGLQNLRASAAGTQAAQVVPQGVVQQGMQVASGETPLPPVTATVNEIVETVAAQMLVTPALAQGEGEIRIILKPTVLDGSAITLTAQGGELTVTIAVATPEAAQIAVAALPRLEAALAAHAPAFHHVAARIVAPKKGTANETV